MEKIKMITCMIIIAASVIAQALEMSVDEIMQKVAETQRGVETEYAEFQTILLDKKGKENKRELIFVAKYESEDKIRIDIKSPEDIKDTKFLLRGDEQWLYMPTLKRSLKIASNSRKQRFVGSDFIYEDIELENPEKHSYELSDTKNEHWIIKAFPKNKSAYGFRKLWVRQDNYFVMQTEYHDEQDQLVKKRTDSNIKEIQPSIWRAEKITMEDLVNQTKTTLIFQKRVVNIDLPSKIFNSKNLSESIKKQD